MQAFYVFQNEHKLEFLRNTVTKFWANKILVILQILNFQIRKFNLKMEID